VSAACFPANVPANRQVTKMKMISPSNREVDVGKTLSETEYIGMCRREVMDAYLRDRAEKLGANIVNGLMMKMEQPGGCCCDSSMCVHRMLLLGR
jgi:geranylgeranyl reductase